jgi:hypothetical protein
MNTRPCELCDQRPATVRLGLDDEFVDVCAACRAEIVSGDAALLLAAAGLTDDHDEDDAA